MVPQWRLGAAEGHLHHVLPSEGHLQPEYGRIRNLTMHMHLTCPAPHMRRFQRCHLCRTILATHVGPLAIEDLGIARLREQCPHLDSWLARLDRPPSR